MRQEILIIGPLLSALLFLGVGGCETPKKSKKSTTLPPTSGSGTEITENIETNVTIAPNAIEEYYIIPASSGSYVLYILDVNSSFAYKCDFVQPGMKGEREGENYCLLNGLVAGTSYSFTLESYEITDTNLSLLLVADDLTSSSFLTPQTLELNTSVTTRIGAYRNTGYFTFTTEDTSGNIRVYVQKNGVPLTMEIFSSADFTGRVSQWTLPKETTDSVAPILNIDLNTTYYMTAQNGGSTYADLTLKVDHYPLEDNNTTTPSSVMVGTLYEGLELTDRQNRYDFDATKEEHNITVVSDALLWSLYAPIDGTYQSYFRCWSSSNRTTKCHVSGLIPGTEYHLYVGCFFAPACTTEHSLLIE